MKKEYLLTSQEALEIDGINLEELSLDSSYVITSLRKAFNISVTRICTLCDNIEDELDIEKKLDENPRKVAVFKKLQSAVLYNLVFTGETSPVGGFIDDIIAHELNIGKVNSIQKGIHYRQ